MNNKKGFTLIELIVVIAILAILSLILVPSFMGYAKDAKAVGCLSNRTNIERLFRYYEAKHPQEVITLTDYLTKVDGENDIAEFKCPSGGVYSMDTNDQHVVACSEHSETTADTPSGGKINGTELGNGNVQKVENGTSLGTSLATGSIIEIVGAGETKGKQYIVGDPIGNGVTITGSTSGLIELTNTKAIDLDKDFFNQNNGIINQYYKENIKIGVKVLYDGKYYVARLNPSWDAPKPGAGSYFWLEIKE